MRQIVLDTETTGLETAQGHRLIEIGGVELLNRKFTGRQFHQYINPEREMDAEAFAVHGISNEFLRDKPKFVEIVEEFLAFVGDAELIIHNAPFDLGFINHELQLWKKETPLIQTHCSILDTLILARQLHVGQRNSLDALCKRYSIDNTHRDLHGALLDAKLLAQVYLIMTGGQSSLFEESNQLETVHHHSTDVVVAPVNRHLRVLEASSEELVLHEEHLNKVQAKGKCLWRA